jgi:hypothetical protein
LVPLYVAILRLLRTNIRNDELMKNETPQTNKSVAVRNI